MTNLELLIISTASLGVFHTLLGPDHYLPFIMMARAEKWSKLKTAWVTFFCGLGHVAGSLLLGFVGASLGLGLRSLEMFESVRADFAARCLIAFGLIYCVWGIRRANQHSAHQHVHRHDDATFHSHRHVHTEQHMHIHSQEKMSRFTPWMLFCIFVFGPCEPLIPILLYPAATLDLAHVLIVAGVFALCTISSMLALVLIASVGLEYLPFRQFERYTHALAGGTVFFCGLGIIFLGL